MPRITEEHSYDGALERIERLGLRPLIDEVRTIVSGFELLVEERRDANGGAFVRKALDERFERVGGWLKKMTGDVDWTKCQIINGSRVCIGVEIQTSGRSDLIVVDLVHLRRAIVDGVIDVGVLIVPSEQLCVFLTDRGPSIADAKRLATEARVEDLPLLFIAFAHDGPGPALPKQRKRSPED